MVADPPGEGLAPANLNWGRSTGLGGYHIGSMAIRGLQQMKSAMHFYMWCQTTDHEPHSTGPN